MKGTTNKGSENMKLLMIGFVLIVITVAIALMKKRNETEEITDGEPLPYYRKNLLNPKEQTLFLRLVEAMPDHYVMAQVRLADIIGVERCKKWQTWTNKITKNSVDFVICNKSFEVLACIELDGKTHEQEDRKRADKNKDNALKAARITIHRIEASKLPTVEEIKKLLH
jgi:very-short-patch-repair endonuclease